jgi:RimJ/RimL family protein N-acetyltransferase
MLEDVTSGPWSVGPDPVTVIGSGLVLREWAQTDLARMVELFDEPGMDRWTPLDSPFDLAAARRYLDRAAARRSDGSAVQCAITQDGLLPLGELLLFDDGGRSARLGYSVGLAHRGRGLASRALRLMVDHAAGDWGFRRFGLQIEPSNTSSVRVAHACGFVRTGEPDVQVLSRGRPIVLARWERSVPRAF